MRAPCLDRSVALLRGPWRSGSWVVAGVDPGDGGAMDRMDVIVAGAGPTGLVLAAELALGGVVPVVLERRATQDLAGARAGGLHARTLELLDQRGVAERFVAAGTVHRLMPYFAPLDFSGLPTRHNGVLALFQN